MSASLYRKFEAIIDPPSEEERDLLASFDSYADTHLPSEVSDELEATGRFPEAELSALLRGSIGTAMTPRAQGGSMRWSSLLRVCSHLAAHDLGVTLCLGGAMLAALPVIVAGNEDQKRRFFDRIRRGEVAGLGLSEWERGSDLLSNDTVATPVDVTGAEVSLPEASQFRLTGQKRPINNATRGGAVVVLARTGDPDDPFGATLFLLEREQPGLGTLDKLQWSGYPSMDLSGIDLRDALVSGECVLGKPGEGFVHTRATLGISRGGVAAMSVGASAAVVDEAWRHSRERRLYGSTIDSLDGVQLLLARSTARLCLAIALCRLAANSASWAPTAARPLTSAAKFLCPELLELNIRDCGTILGARSFLTARKMARLRRDGPIFAIFDGSSQLQLDELWRAVGRWPQEDAGDVDSSWQALRKPATADLEDDGSEELLGVAAPTRSLAGKEVHQTTLRRCAHELAALATGARGWSQARRFVLSDVAARLYGLGALNLAARSAVGDDAELLQSIFHLGVAEHAPELARAMVELGAKDGGELSGELLMLGAERSEQALSVFSCASRFLS